MQTIQLDHASLTRIGYADVPIPAHDVGLSPSDFAGLSWREPAWSEGQQVRVGAAAWLAEVADKRIVFDPVQAADGVLRADPNAELLHQSAFADLCAGAGFPRESVDLVVLSHIEDVGMVGWRGEDGHWSPFFPNARILLSAAALQALEASGGDAGLQPVSAAWRAFIDGDRVGTFADGEVLAPGLVAEVRGGHGPGHAILHFGEDPLRAQLTMIGHLALSPIHLATGECARMHEDAATAWEQLQRIAADGRILVGSLWPAPAHGRWINGAFVPGT